jgi:hypothetical protein
VSFHYDGVYGGHKFLAQGKFRVSEVDNYRIDLLVEICHCIISGDFRFDSSNKINYIEYTVINGFEGFEGAVGRGVRCFHGDKPAQEARNKQIVLQRISVLNGRNHDDAVRFVHANYAPEFVSCSSAVWTKCASVMVKAFDDAFAVKSTILDPKFLDDGITAERVEYSYRGLYNGAQYNAFCSVSFNEAGKILSENWRLVE